MIINRFYHRHGLYSANEIHEKIVFQGYIPIANASELNNIRYTGSYIFGLGTPWQNTYVSGRDKKFIQVNHINLFGIVWNNIANPTAGQWFTGIYDGNRLRIENMRSENIAYASLFGGIDTGLIENVICNNCYVTNSGIGGRIAIIAVIINNAIGKISNCQVFNSTAYSPSAASSAIVVARINGIVEKCIAVNCTVNAITNSTIGVFGDTTATGIVNDCIAVNCTVNGGYLVGGFIGDNGGLIENCGFIGSVSANRTDTVLRLGGFVGSLSSSTSIIRNSFCISSITSVVNGFYLGGFAGLIYGLSENCYCHSSINGISANGYVGGFVGGMTGVAIVKNGFSCSTITNTATSRNGFCGRLVSGLIENSYWNVDLYPTSTNAVGKMTTQLKVGVPGINIYTNWDENIWNFLTENDYPILKTIKTKWQLLN